MNWTENGLFLILTSIINETAVFFFIVDAECDGLITMEIPGMCA